jgi:cell division initiation protein
MAKVTPLDIRKQTFKKGMRGYETGEVQAFLEMVAKEFEELARENAALLERMAGLDAQIEDYRKMEKALRETMLAAQQTTEGIKENARAEADLLLREAQHKADGIVAEARHRAQGLQRDVAVLEQQRNVFIAQFKSLVESQLNLLEEMHSGRAAAPSAPSKTEALEEDF